MKAKCYFKRLVIFFFAMLFMASCEKPFIGDEDGDGDVKGTAVVVKFNASNVEQSTFVNDSDSRSVSRSSSSLSDLCRRLSLAVFDMEGKRVKTITQQNTDKNFGLLELSLPQETYTFVFIAENGSGSPTMTKPTEIKFKDNKVTDTFYYCGELTLDENSNYDIVLRRAVAMFRLVVNDVTPSDVKQMKFYYTGGSSTFDATTGYGCVNSKQTEYRTVATDAYDGSSSYDLYTFPHEDGKTLQMEISALAGMSATANVKYVRTIEDIPMETNVITSYKGNFFGESPEGGRSFNLTVEDEWQENSYEY